MPLFIKSQLRETVKNARIEKAEKFLKNAATSVQDSDRFDIFLSHSYKDAEEILGLKKNLESFNYSVYVDWYTDSHLDRESVTKQTADQIRERMRQCKCLFYVSSENAERSVWMPWELGYFDGLNRVERMNIDGKVAICPLVDQEIEEYQGQEYLGLYPYISLAKLKDSAELILWVNRAPEIYVPFNKWLQGQQPYKHN